MKITDLSIVNMDEVHDVLLIGELLAEKFVSIFHCPRNGDENGYRKVQRLSTGNRFFAKKLKSVSFNGRQVKVLDIQDLFTSKLKLHDYVPELVIPEQNLATFEFTSVDFVADTNKTPMLHLECARGDLLMVRMLIDNGAKVNRQQDNGNTALMEAVFIHTDNHLEITRLLLAAGADVNIQNKTGYSAFTVAASTGNVRALKLMKDWKGIKVNTEVTTKNGMTALIIAASRANRDMMKYLVEQCDANILAATNDGKWTAYNLVTAYTTDYCMKYLGEKLIEKSLVKTYVRRRIYVLKRNTLDPQLMLTEMVSLPPLFLLEASLMPNDLRRTAIGVLMDQSDASLDDHDQQCYVLHRLIPWFLMLTALRCRLRPLKPETQRAVVLDFFSLNADELLLKCVTIYQEDDIMMFNFIRIISFLCSEDEGRKWVEKHGEEFQRWTKVTNFEGRFCGRMQPPVHPRFSVPCVQLIRCETADDINGRAKNIDVVKYCIERCVADKNMNKLIKEDEAEKRKREKKRDRKKRRQQQKREEAKEKTGSIVSSDESDHDAGKDADYGIFDTPSKTKELDAELSSVDSPEDVDYGIFSTPDDKKKDQRSPECDQEADEVRTDAGDAVATEDGPYWGFITTTTNTTENYTGFAKVTKKSATKKPKPLPNGRPTFESIAAPKSHALASTVKAPARNHNRQHSGSTGGRPIPVRRNIPAGMSNKQFQRQMNKLKEKANDNQRLQAIKDKSAWPAQNTQEEPRGTYVPAPIENLFDGSAHIKVNKLTPKKSTETYDDFINRLKESPVKNEEVQLENAKAFMKARGVEGTVRRPARAGDYGLDTKEFPTLPVEKVPPHAGVHLEGLHKLPVKDKKPNPTTLKDLGEEFERSHQNLATVIDWDKDTPAEVVTSIHPPKAEPQVGPAQPVLQIDPRVKPEQNTGFEKDGKPEQRGNISWSEVLTNSHLHGAGANATQTENDADVKIPTRDNHAKHQRQRPPNVVGSNAMNTQPPAWEDMPEWIAKAIEARVQEVMSQFREETKNATDIACHEATATNHPSNAEKPQPEIGNGRSVYKHTDTSAAIDCKPCTTKTKLKESKLNSPDHMENESASSMITNEVMPSDVEQDVALTETECFENITTDTDLELADSATITARTEPALLGMDALYVQTEKNMVSSEMKREDLISETTHSSIVVEPCRNEPSKRKETGEYTIRKYHSNIEIPQVNDIGMLLKGLGPESLSQPNTMKTELSSRKSDAGDLALDTDNEKHNMFSQVVFENVANKSFSAIMDSNQMLSGNLRRNKPREQGMKTTQPEYDVRKMVHSSTLVPNVVQQVYRAENVGRSEADPTRFIIHVSGSESSDSDSDLQRNKPREQGMKTTQPEYDVRKMIHSSTLVPNVVQQVYRAENVGRSEADQTRFIIHVSGSESSDSDSESEDIYSSCPTADMAEVEQQPALSYSTCASHGMPAEQTQKETQTNQGPGRIVENIARMSVKDDLDASAGFVKEGSPSPRVDQLNQGHGVEVGMDFTSFANKLPAEDLRRNLDHPESKIAKAPKVFDIETVLSQAQRAAPAGYFFPSMPTGSVFAQDLETLLSTGNSGRSSQGEREALAGERTAIFASDLEARLIASASSSLEQNCSHPTTGHKKRHQTIAVVDLEAKLRAEADGNLEWNVPISVSSESGHDTPRSGSSGTSQNKDVILEEDQIPSMFDWKSSNIDYDHRGNQPSHENASQPVAAHHDVKSLQENHPDQSPQTTSPPPGFSTLMSKNLQDSQKSSVQSSPTDPNQPSPGLCRSPSNPQETSLGFGQSPPFRGGYGAPCSWIPRSLAWHNKLKRLFALDENIQLRLGGVFSSSDPSSLIYSHRNGVRVMVGMSYDGHEFALKRILKVNYRSLESWLTRMRRLQMDNRFLARYFDCIEDIHFGYFAMELCEYNLTQYMMLLSNAGRLTTQALPICYQILCGLQALHDVAMLHMNLKPTNVIIDAEGRVKLSDYGLFYGIPKAHSQSLRSLLNVCWCPTEVLNPKYQGFPYTSASDVQVAGMLIHYVLTGGLHPFGDDAIQCQHNIKSGNPRFGAGLGFLGQHLLSWMLPPDMHKRKFISECLLHPLFWPENKRFAFILTVAEQSDVREKKKTTVTKEIDSYAKWIGCTDWKQAVAAAAAAVGLRRGEEVYSSSVCDLLRCIGDTSRRFRQMPLEYQSNLVNPRFYFDRLYPKLFLPIYDIVYKTDWKSRQSLCPFFLRQRM